MKRPRLIRKITESERVERVLDKLHDRAHEKAMAMRIVAEPLLGPEFLGDMHELPSEFVQEIEERAEMLEEAVRTGKLGRGNGPQ